MSGEAAYTFWLVNWQLLKIKVIMPLHYHAREIKRSLISNNWINILLIFGHQELLFWVEWVCMLLSPSSRSHAALRSCWTLRLLWKHCSLVRRNVMSHVYEALGKGWGLNSLKILESNQQFHLGLCYSVFCVL